MFSWNRYIAYTTQSCKVKSWVETFIQQLIYVLWTLNTNWGNAGLDFEYKLRKCWVENKLGLNFCNIWWVGPVCLLIHLYPDIQTDKTCSWHNQLNTTMAEEIVRRMRAAQQQTERASGKWLLIYLFMHIYFCFYNSEPPLLGLGTNVDVDILD